MKDDGDRTARGAALELLAGLLAADEAELLEAFHRDRLATRGVSLADAATARQLLLEIVATLEMGDPESSERIALALDATLPHPSAPTEPAALATPPGVSVDATLPAILAAVGSLDATLPAVAPPAPPPRVEVSSPPSLPRPVVPTPAARRVSPQGDDPLAVSVDDTVMFDALEAINLESGREGVVNWKVERWAEPSAHVAQPASGGRDGSAAPARDAEEDPLAPQLDLDRYAILCAWAELQPERRAVHNRQYGLPDEEARRRLEQSFEELFAADPSLKAEFQRRMRMHLAWLEK